MLTSNQLGEAGALTVDTSQLKTSMSLTQTVKPQDALLASGRRRQLNLRRLDFVLEQPIHRRAPRGDASDRAADRPAGDGDRRRRRRRLSTAVQTLVNDYNSYHTTLTTDTAYTPQRTPAPVLSDDPTTIQTDASRSGLFNGQILGAGPSNPSRARRDVNSEVPSPSTARPSAGLRVQPRQRPKFFTQNGTGFAVQLNNVANQLAGSGDSLLPGRFGDLQHVEQNTTRSIRSTRC